MTGTTSQIDKIASQLPEAISNLLILNLEKIVPKDDGFGGQSKVIHFYLQQDHIADFAPIDDFTSKETSEWVKTISGGTFQQYAEKFETNNIYGMKLSGLTENEILNDIGMPEDVADEFLELIKEGNYVQIDITIPANKQNYRSVLVFDYNGALVATFGYILSNNKLSGPQMAAFEIEALKNFMLVDEFTAASESSDEFTAKLTKEQKYYLEKVTMEVEDKSITNFKTGMISALEKLTKKN